MSKLLERTLLGYLILLPSCVFGQSFSFPTFKGPIKSVNELLLPKWVIKDSTSGDLNGDHKADMALVLEYGDSVEEMRKDSDVNSGKPRVLLVLLWDSAVRAYSVNVQNNTFVLRSGEGGMGGDPYSGIKIQHGVLEIDYQFLREALTYRFRYKQSTFFLIGASDAGASNLKFESWDFNFSTGMAKHEWQYRSNENAPSHVNWKKMKPRSPIRLGEMRFAYELEIFPNVYI
jgi:hypothetical protein